MLGGTLIGFQATVVDDSKGLRRMRKTADRQFRQNAKKKNDEMTEK